MHILSRSVLTVLGGAVLLCLQGEAYPQDKAGAIDITAVKYDGLAEEIARHRGKVVLVDFWAQYCIPCVKGFPHVLEMHKKYAKEGLVVMTVTIDLANPDTAKLTPELKDKILLKLTKNDMAVTNLVLDEPHAVLDKRLRFSIPPSMYVFDRAGKWTQFNGMRQDKDGKYEMVNELKKDENGKYFEVEALVQKLLAQK